MVNEPSLTYSSSTLLKTSSGCKVFLVVSVALTIFSFLMIMSQLSFPAEFASVRAFTQVTSKALGMNGLTLSLTIFTLNMFGLGSFVGVRIMVSKNALSTSSPKNEPQLINSPRPLFQEPEIPDLSVSPVISPFPVSDLNPSEIGLSISPAVDNSLMLPLQVSPTSLAPITNNSHFWNSTVTSFPHQKFVLNLGPNSRLFVDLNQVDPWQLMQLLQMQTAPRSVNALIPHSSISPLDLPAIKEEFQIIDDGLMVIPCESVNQFPKGNFRDYVARVCPQYLGNYEDLVAKGKAFMESFMHTNKNDPNSPENTIVLGERRSYAAPFVWNLMDEAERRYGKAFKEGMILLSDVDGRIHDFFAEVASIRASTHYKQSRLSSYGIDVEQDYRLGLPGSHQTMHFGKRITLDGTTYTFVKPESWGTESFQQMAGHAISWLLSRIPHLLGNASQAGHYKEHFAELDKDFTILLKEISHDDRATIREWGVAGIVRYLKNFVKMTQTDRQRSTTNSFQQHKKLIKEFVQKHQLARIEGIDAIQGAEVVIADQLTMKRLNEPMQELLALLE